MEGAISQTEKLLSNPKARHSKKRNEPLMPQFIGGIQNKMINGDVLAWSLNSGDSANNQISRQTYDNQYSVLPNNYTLVYGVMLYKSLLKKQM